jgi:hypothetical protein
MQVKRNLNDKAYITLLKLSQNIGQNLSVWQLKGAQKMVESGSICVCIPELVVVTDYDTKNEFGKGFTFESACEDYLNRIRGRLLRINGEEITIL